MDEKVAALRVVSKVDGSGDSWDELSVEKWEGARVDLLVDYLESLKVERKVSLLVERLAAQMVQK